MKYITYDPRWECEPRPVRVCRGASLVNAIVGGVTGYGSGLLMPLILAPIIGPAVVVPVPGVAALFNNASRMAAFRSLFDWRRALIVGLGALPTCALSAWFYTLLSGPRVAMLPRVVLVAMAPARRALSDIDR